MKKDCFGKYPISDFPCEVCMDKQKCIQEDPKRLKKFVEENKSGLIKIKNSKDEFIMNIAYDNIHLGDDCLVFFIKDIITLKISLAHIKKTMGNILYI